MLSRACGHQDDSSLFKFRHAAVLVFPRLLSRVRFPGPTAGVAATFGIAFIASPMAGAVRPFGDRIAARHAGRGAADDRVARSRIGVMPTSSGRIARLLPRCAAASARVRRSRRRGGAVPARDRERRRQRACTAVSAAWRPIGFFLSGPSSSSVGGAHRRAVRCYGWRITVGQRGARGVGWYVRLRSARRGLNGCRPARNAVRGPMLVVIGNNRAARHGHHELCLATSSSSTMTVFTHCLGHTASATPASIHVDPDVRGGVTSRDDSRFQRSWRKRPRRTLIGPRSASRRRGL